MVVIQWYEQRHIQEEEEVQWRTSYHNGRDMSAVKSHI